MAEKKCDDCKYYGTKGYETGPQFDYKIMMWCKKNDHEINGTMTTAKKCSDFKMKDINDIKMKKPETYEKLLELVNPKDLDEIFSFSGINDHRNETHSNLKKQYSEFIFRSIYDIPSFDEEYRLDDRNPKNQYTILNESFYETLIKCIQDFYRWSRRFNHIYAHIYKRVVNALEIPIEELEKIYQIKEEYDKKE